MSARETAWKYQGKNPLEKLHPDEPWFFIRAQDKLSVDAIRAYADLLAKESNHAETEERRDHLMKQAIGLHLVIDGFMDWQEKNADKVKVPD